MVRTQLILKHIKVVNRETLFKLKMAFVDEPKRFSGIKTLVDNRDHHYDSPCRFVHFFLHSSRTQIWRLVRRRPGHTITPRKHLLED